MINQEDLYQLLYNEQWTEILNLLYKEKQHIKNDVLLSFASKTFEAEFLNKVKNYDNSRIDITNNLSKLYLLHHGNFHQLTDENYKTLILEIVKRKPLEEAYQYAITFPDEDICKKIISDFNFLIIKKEGYKLRQPNKTPQNWIEIYNRLFEVINNQSDTATYFSGPRFIDTIRQYEPFFPDYPQFINQRNFEGKSTSRKIFYYDILLGLREDIRVKVITRILEIVKPFEKEKVIAIENIIDNKIPEVKIEKISSIYNNKPNVFISYSWDNKEHKNWVLNLANKLCSDGINVILDRYYLKPGKNLTHFVEENLSQVDRVIVIFTKNYKLKADKRTGGVGYEYSIMNVELYNNQTSNEKIIPILREGTKEESIPTFMQQFIHIDTRNDENFENSYIDLIREIYNEPEIKKPKIGEKPIF
ncbi:TIR domain-containing protein [Myroides sp. BIT-d1]|uniref:TIR domain-containing protein n=1 Tax=Myroides albus TaxID=2562892 RepID=A0A6I3LL78_9FLAO|nr:toll/interleukin-1 receptor domain-containing protein [Myroides albus]MTG99103.1 TIR domain-containing protein [Myroides albus]